MLALLLAAVGLVAIYYSVNLIGAVVRARIRPGAEALALGVVTNFFDTLGIGSFASTTAWVKFRRMIPDRWIPATLIAGHSAPTIVQALVFLTLLGVAVDPVLLVGSAVALGAGARLGVPLVARMRVWVVQLTVGVGLILAAAAFAAANLGLMPAGGTASGLSPALTTVAIAAFFGFGVLINFGIGHYAPGLAMLSLMGLDPRLCFPILAGGGALAVAGAAVSYIRRAEIDLRVALGLALGGIPAVFVAAFLVKEMPVTLLRWMVCAVVLYAAGAMLRSAWQGWRGGASAPIPD